ncbi:thioredoxin domain-containing protein [Sulfurovum sp. XTW-4]|uniref:Thioredoxin domain-containing protein n=1 Tax=Sulfurovum xiamenensis TaxID=3019066 RepID=A0ABT7QT67_9BACT|nr:thioredoxin domain-containing protein [Sulfurovum xiamenensis]MDM5264263.1 thioredoxin domain-containing protein [Sulfurovum xiamenensis]
MSLMSKLLMSTVLASVTLSANAQPDNKQLVKYVKRSVVKNPQVKVKGVTVLESKTDERLPGWTILLTTMDLEYQKKEIHAPEMMFVKDGLVTGHLVNLKTGNDYRDEIKPSVPQSYYDDAHLLFGKKDAEHKILIFSDPQCPFCQEVVPAIFKVSKENPAKIAVYYYHLPLLRIHPVSDVLTRVMHVAQHEGKTDVVEKIYSLKIDPRETDMSKILAAVKSHTGYSVTAAQVDAKEVKAAMQADEMASSKLMVTGTPTIYIDGEWDKMRDGYKKLIK